MVGCTSACTAFCLAGATVKLLPGSCCSLYLWRGGVSAIVGSALPPPAWRCYWQVRCLLVLLSLPTSPLLRGCPPTGTAVAVQHWRCCSCTVACKLLPVRAHRSHPATRQPSTDLLHPLPLLVRDPPPFRLLGLRAKNACVGAAGCPPQSMQATRGSPHMCWYAVGGAVVSGYKPALTQLQRRHVPVGCLNTW
jgi:hypothetical protein